MSAMERGDAHGFEVWRRLEEDGCGALKLKEGSLYPALYRLEKKGFVKARWDKDDRQRKGPRRRVYRLTRKGKRQLDDGRQQWAHFASVVGAIVGVPS